MRTFRPIGDAATWDVRLLATLAILSECTPGQGEHVGPMLNSVVEYRSGFKSEKGKKNEMIEDDVFYVVRDWIKQTKEKVCATSSSHSPLFTFNLLIFSTPEPRRRRTSTQAQGRLRFPPQEARSG
jgi:hypothetical protein